MPFRKNHLAWAVGIAILGIGQQAAADNTVTLPEVKVEGQSVDNHTRLQQEELASLKAQGPDAARLLQAVPGMSLRGAGASRPCRYCAAWPMTDCWYALMMQPYPPPAPIT
ncbi:hypothetical protein ACFSQE_07120 [Vogesella fluminis]|uniref:hypothetical protein n=1 Tax=Vogesella fluminis TaxID=1069161 RepID=UPI0036434024